MNIENISRSKFNQLLSSDSAVSNLTVQVAWFSNPSGNLLGALTKSKGRPEWNYVILKRDKEGDCHIHQVMNGFLSSEAAKADLLMSMAEVALIEPDLAVAVFS
jgi:hypothetical protein